MLNSNEEEGTTNDISLSLALINVKDSQNFYVGVSKPRLSVLGCLEHFFQILRFEIGGAAYLWMRLIHGHLRQLYIFLLVRHFYKSEHNQHNSITVFTRV